MIILDLNERFLYQVADKVEETKQKCCSDCSYLVSIVSLFFLILLIFGQFF